MHDAQESTVDVAEAEAEFEALVERVERGEVIVITDRGRPVARLVPVGEPESVSREQRAPNPTAGS
jgi:prevent-host-death family protein